MNNKTDIVIFGGQSNMQGQTECLSENRPVGGAYEYRYISDTLVPLRNPVGENISYDIKQGKEFEADTNQNEWLKAHVTGSACYGHTNLVPQFCRAYISSGASGVVAVHIAKGSTVIADWLPGTPGYDIIVKKASAAITKAKSEFAIGKIYFVWLQGESDAVASNSKEYYKEKLNILNDSLKKDLGIYKFGIICVGRFTGDERDDEIINAQNEVCIENDSFVMLTRFCSELEADSEYMNPDVSGHYSAMGCEKIGMLAGKKLYEA